MKKFNIKTLPIIGMSPGNSYFTEEKIFKITKLIVQKYGYAVIVTPDIPAIATYRGMGYSESKSIKKLFPRETILGIEQKELSKNLDFLMSKSMS